MVPRQTVAVPSELLQRLWVVLAVAAVSMGVTAIQGVLRPGYDSWHQAVSALSLGPGGWIQMINLVVLGVVIASTAPAWRRLLAGGVGALSYPTLTFLVGASFVVVGLIPQDPAPGYDPASLALASPTARGLVHLAIAGVAALSSVAGLVVISGRFRGDPAWRGWSAYTRAMAALVVACVAVFAVWSREASGLAGTFERLAIGIPMLWTYTFLRRLAAGTPFMITARPETGRIT